MSVEVINIHTIKPLDEAAILESISKTKCAVTVEEHNIIGGLGDSIAQVAAKNLPIPIEFIGTKDTFYVSHIEERSMFFFEKNCNGKESLYAKIYLPKGVLPALNKFNPQVFYEFYRNRPTGNKSRFISGWSQLKKLPRLLRRLPDPVRPNRPKRRLRRLLYRLV